MTKKWSDRAWEATQPIFQQILELPFIKELMNGTLDRKKFNFYIQQDALYLADYGKVLAGATLKLKKTEHIDAFIHFAGESVAVEKALHASFTNELSGQKLEASPSCLLYTSYLMKQLSDAPAEVIVAATLPCFRIYQEVGDYILAHQNADNNPYQSWIDTYGGDDFAASVALATSIADELAENCTPEQLDAMTQAFILCSKMEWKFWESAWRLEQWEI